MNLPDNPSLRVAALRNKLMASTGRINISLDATASREEAWDQAMQLQFEMFEATAKLGTLEAQLSFFRGAHDVQHSPWTSDPQDILERMTGIKCAAGTTKIARLLEHTRQENELKKVNAMIFIGDACEESPVDLYRLAEGLKVPVFLFQEGDGEVLLDIHNPLLRRAERVKVETVFREIAKLTGGAYEKFNAGSARKLAELLSAVAAFAIGGTKALASQNTESARKLLSQVK